MKLAYKNILITSLLIIGAIFLYILQVVTIQKINIILAIIGILTLVFGILITIWAISVLPKKYSKLTIIGMLCPAISGILGGSAMLVYGVIGPLYKYNNILLFDPILIIAIAIIVLTIGSPIIIVIGRAIEKKKAKAKNDTI